MFCESLIISPLLVTLYWSHLCVDEKNLSLYSPRPRSRCSARPYIRTPGHRLAAPCTALGSTPRSTHPRPPPPPATHTCGADNGARGGSANRAARRGAAAWLPCAVPSRRPGRRRTVGRKGWACVAVHDKIRHNMN